ncbi:MAG TPA: VCBS repeat-containing protein, partial [Gemmataceae bacterium]|nr:VCBS repeat-containing protein [Gemmataceae bacterium]
MAGSLFCSAIVCAVILTGQRLTASFITAPQYAAGPHPRAVAVGDFNGDGIPDLAVANYGSFPNSSNGGVSILLGNADGSFQAAQSYRTGEPVVSVAVGDFNGDGKLDVVTAGRTLSVLLGNGDGTFQAAQSFASGFVAVAALAAGDFNNDGKLDLVVVGESNAFGDVV